MRFKWRSRKIFSTMRLSALLMLVFTFSLSAETRAQQERINLDVKNVSINTLLREIQRQTKFNFVFSIDQTADLGTFTVQAENEELESVLRRTLTNRGLTFEFMDDLILIRRLDEEKKDEKKEINITGTVTDTEKTPLPGVTVKLKGTSLGTATDTDGKYKLKFMDTGKPVVLEFSFVGMKSDEKTYAGKDTINVVMEEDKVALEDVVVTGYANISRQSFTGNVKSMTATELKKISPTNVLQSLQVLDPSFRIKINNEMGSNPNALPEITMRGASGIGVTELDATNVSRTALQNDPNLPTFILDGFEVSVTKVYDLDINRIESITLLKDAAATAIYGSRAANGVVVITTIPPQPGEVLLTYNYNLEVQIPDLRDYNLMNAREKLEAEKTAGMYNSTDGVQEYNQILRSIEEGLETDWISKPLRNTASSKHSLRLEGGNTHGLRYAINLNSQANNGGMKDAYRQTKGFGFDLQYNYKKFRFTNMASYSGMKSEESPYGSFSEYTGLNPYYAYLDDEGNILKTVHYRGKDIGNPLWDATVGNYNKSEYKEFTNNFSIQYYFTDALHLKGNIAFSYTSNSGEIFTSPDDSQFETYSSYEGSITYTDGSVTDISGGLNLYYNDLIGNHSINLVVGLNWQESNDNNRTISLRDLPRGNFTQPQFAKELASPINNQGQKSRLFGALLSFNYTYDNIYLADFTGRFDGSSTFGSDSRIAPFWSMGLGVNIHNYASMKNISWLQELKIRGSYGLTGKANFPAQTAQTVYTVNSDFVYPTGVGVDMSAMGNTNLKWERTKTLDVGTDVSLFGGKFSFTYAYYRKRTVDLISDMTIPASSGFTSYKENIGEVLNTGHELDVRLRLVGKNDMQWYVSGNLASNKNRIDKLSDAMKDYNQRIEERYQSVQAELDAFGSIATVDAAYLQPMIKYTEGASTTAIYAMRSLGIDPQTGKELFLYRDGRVATEWLASENVVCGDTEPDFNGTLSTNFYWKGLSVDVYFTYTYGGQQYNNTLRSKIENADLEDNVDKRVFTERWKQPGDRVRFKSLQDWEDITRATSRFVENDNTLTLQSLSVGYEVPAVKLRQTFFRQLRFSFNMSDVFRISTIEQERGLSYPFARSFNFSVNVGF